MEETPSPYKRVHRDDIGVRGGAIIKENQLKRKMDNDMETRGSLSQNAG